MGTVKNHILKVCAVLMLISGVFVNPIDANANSNIDIQTFRYTLSSFSNISARVHVSGGNAVYLSGRWRHGTYAPATQVTRFIVSEVIGTGGCGVAIADGASRVVVTARSGVTASAYSVEASRGNVTGWDLRLSC